MILLDSERKARKTLAAKLALVGLAMRVIRKDGGVEFYEVRRDAEAHTCSTLHGVRAMLAAQIGGAT